MLSAVILIFIVTPIIVYVTCKFLESLMQDVSEKMDEFLK